MHNPQPDQRQHYRALYTLLSAAALTLLAVSMLNVSIPSMTKALRLTSNDVQWIMAGYTLVFGLALIPSGRLGDTWGHRRLFVIGVAVFAVSSLGAGLAMTPLTLILMRLLAGVGAAIISPQILGLIQILFHGQERARAYGSFGMIIGIATAIGPTMGGLLIAMLGTNLGWRAAFLINIPICIVIIFVTYHTIAPDPAKLTSDTRLDLPGILVLAAAFLAVMYPFIDATMPSGGFGTWRWLLLPGGALGFLGFWALENSRERREIPVVMPRSLLLDASYMVGTTVLTAFSAGWTALFIIYTLYLQQGLGISPLVAGLLQIPLALGSAIASAQSSRLTLKWGRWILVISCALVILCLVITVLITRIASPDTIPYLLIISMFGSGLGSGIFFSPAQALSLLSVPAGRAGAAGGISQTAQRVGGAIGLAGATLAFYLRLRSIDASPGSTPAREAYTGAFSYGMSAVIAFIIIAFLFSLVDALKRRENPLKFELNSPEEGKR
ncbi:MFS transporter [Varibaculum vaginae]|uniref:MFS transporter n=1 Tax=Varibaculum vaginae TaxID=2364797 RepID=UPI000F0975F8|nr:MFS transporter [Varibaculum vaginae]